MLFKGEVLRVGREGFHAEFTGCQKQLTLCHGDASSILDSGGKMHGGNSSVQQDNMQRGAAQKELQVLGVFLNSIGIYACHCISMPLPWILGLSVLKESKHMPGGRMQI